MKKTVLLCAALCILGTTAYADGAYPRVDNPSTTATAAVQYETTPTPQEYAEKMPTDRKIEIIDTKEMQARLENGKAEDFLYLKFADDTVLVYEALADDKAFCQELLMASPKELIVNVYTNNKKTMKTLWKAIKANKGEWDAVGGYRLAGAKSPVNELENGGEVYRMWYQKVKADGRRVKVRRRGFGLPISIGIPVGHGHHRPHIGIGL